MKLAFSSKFVVLKIKHMQFSSIEFYLLVYLTKILQNPQIYR